MTELILADAQTTSAISVWIWFYVKLICIKIRYKALTETTRCMNIQKQLLIKEISS